MAVFIVLHSNFCTSKTDFIRKVYIFHMCAGVCAMRGMPASQTRALPTSCENRYVGKQANQKAYILL